MTKFFALALSAAIALSAPSACDACWRGGYGYYDYGCCDYGWGCRYAGPWMDCCQVYRYSYAPSYYYAMPSTYVYPMQAYQPSSRVVASNTANIRVLVPPGAKLWFDDQRTTQTGSDRLFETPSLTPGQDYHYSVKAQWRDQDGKDVALIRQVDVRANATVNVDFTTKP
jgi:uncharacterized protein (TIGR03000 family)